jgi:hypothetical protein
MPADSRAAHEEARTLQEKLLEDFKDSKSRPDYQSGLGAILDNYAHALLGDPGEEKRVREFLAQALPCHQAAVKANPGNPAYRQYFCNHFVVEAERLLAGRKLADAASVADGLPDVVTEAGLERSWPEHVTAARILTKCATAVETKGQPFADRAVAALRTAIRLGYRNAVEMRKASYFSALQSREDFQKLVTDLEKREKQP